MAPREFNPRFEAEFALGADYDPDRQRSEARKLQRQLVKEKRGAMRELRRDAVFMSAVGCCFVWFDCTCGVLKRDGWLSPRTWYAKGLHNDRCL